MIDITEIPEFRARAAVRRSTWQITGHDSLEAMKDAEYRFWAMEPAHVKLAAISELTTHAYALKGIHVRRLQRPHLAPE
jgi:hypothetical protein